MHLSTRKAPINDASVLREAVMNRKSGPRHARVPNSKMGSRRGGVSVEREAPGRIEAVSRGNTCGTMGT